MKVTAKCQAPKCKASIVATTASEVRGRDIVNKFIANHREGEGHAHVFDITTKETSARKPSVKVNG